MNKTFRAAQCVAVFVCCWHVSAAFAGWPTDEQLALSQFQAERLPLTLSRDGNWVVYVDGDLVLHRRHITDRTKHQTVKLPKLPSAVSASRTGLKVVLAHVGLVDFQAAEPQLRVWKPYDWESKGVDLAAIQVLDGPPNMQGVAISPDGKRLAMQDSRARLFVADEGNREVLFEVPTQSDGYGYNHILNVAFVDQGRKILVVESILSQRLDHSNGKSDVRFSLWDIEKLALLNFFHTERDQLSYEDFLWSFSEATGELWTLRTNEKSEQELESFNLKECGKPMRRNLGKQKHSTVELSADPYGRWVATVEISSVLAKSALTIRDGATGSALQTIQLQNPMGSLAWAAQDGALVGSEGRTTKGSWTADDPPPEYFGGGTLVYQALKPKIDQSGMPQEKTWSSERCLIEDETPDARNTTHSRTEPVKLYEINLDAKIKYSNQCHCCSVASIHVSEDANILIDYGIEYIEKIDALTGRRLGNITTPRKAGVCSALLFHRKLFLSWQGDTVTSRSFSENGVGNDRRVLAQKLGWTVEEVHFDNAWIGIDWCKRVPVSMGGPPYYTCAEYIKEAYALDSGKLLEAKDFEEIEDENASPAPKPEIKPGEYRWELSYMGTIRARHRPITADEVKTVFWPDLVLEKSLDGPLRFGANAWLEDLGSGKAALVGYPRPRLVIYDAATRRRLADLSFADMVEDSGFQGVWWIESKQVLLVNRYSAQGRFLTAYKIAQPPAAAE